ncbi:hypothetical protein CRUP_025698 [Coryphaenoides rupestris]|nr:hypothetical protein CRUP_025698 [Coryphaenoides rupestris]
MALGANANARVSQAATQRGAKKTTAVLLSEEELVDLLNKDTDGDLDEEQEVEEEIEEENVDGREVKADRDPEKSEEEEAKEEKEEKSMEKHLKMLDVGEEVKERDELKAAMPEEEMESVIQTGPAVEEADGSSDSEILADLDYASDADHGTHLHLTESFVHAGDELKDAKLTPTITDGEQALRMEEMADQAQDPGEQREEQEVKKEAQEPKLAEDQLLETPTESSGEVGEERPPVQEQENQAEGGDNKTKGTGSVSSKGKKRKGLRQRARKHTLQGRDQAGRGPQPTPQPGAWDQTAPRPGARDQTTAQPGARDQTTPQPGAPDQPTDSAVPAAKRRRAGKWTHLVGMNPVQIRATVDLYLSNKPSVGGANPCSSFRCKRGKTCKLSADLTPACVCQEPSDCPVGLSNFDHVCGTDNKTYGTACELFATKCNLEGTKRGHKLHLDYTGPCKRTYTGSYTGALQAYVHGVLHGGPASVRTRGPTRGPCKRTYTGSYTGRPCKRTYTGSYTGALQAYVHGVLHGEALQAYVHGVLHGEALQAYVHGVLHGGPASVRTRGPTRGALQAYVHGVLHGGPASVRTRGPTRGPCKRTYTGSYTGRPCKRTYTGSYTGALQAELVQFPLRMRDWLKNVLLQLYEHDSISPGFLTAKQRAKVRKIHENEKRLHAGDHPLDLLAQDFEKNYNLYIYPVHWQFAQMDKHPSDRLLSHSELASLRVPLVPMEHCTSRFFQECDGDRDKQLSFPEWAHCFGIQDGLHLAKPRSTPG